MRKVVIALSVAILGGCSQEKDQPKSENVPPLERPQNYSENKSKNDGPFGFTMGAKLEQLSAIKPHDTQKNSQWLTNMAPGDAGDFDLFALTITKINGLCSVDASATSVANVKPILEALKARLADKYGKINSEIGRELPTSEGYRQGDFSYKFTWAPKKETNLEKIELAGSYINGNPYLTLKYKFVNYQDCMKEIASKPQI
ncbi:hypothetical protein ACUXVY_19000 [Chromobacterium haemolyticum]|uniref:hypothetical protein n=1 Tax=Chromobacterium haemolyticum TaxID=394935 RepID=UPI004055DDCE